MKTVNMIKWIASDIPVVWLKAPTVGATGLGSEYKEKNIPCIEIPWGLAGGSLQLISMIILVLFFAGIALAEDLQVRQPTESEIGLAAQCAVTKESFEVSKDTAVLDYKGKSYFFCCPGCVFDFKKDPEKYATGGEFSQRTPSKNETGQTTKCPVTKAEFEVAPDTPVLDYKGRSYFFCCASCIDKFKADPEKFMK